MSIRTSVPTLLSLLCGLIPAHPATSHAAEALVEFVESRGCRVLASMRSATRMKEIAAQGSVTWDGECRNGLIDGPGILRHQGSTRENERIRHFAFYLSGNAIAGKRVGPWRRESFNKFADSDQYWTSITSIPYADGVARDPLRHIALRSEADFSDSFRQLLRVIDHKPESAKTGGDRVMPGRPAFAPEPSQTAGDTTATPAASPAARVPAVPAVPPSANQAGATPSANRAERPAPAAEGNDQQARLRPASLNPYGAVAMWLGQISQAATKEGKGPVASGGCVVETINDAAVGKGSIAVSATEPIQIAGRAAGAGLAPGPLRAWMRFVSSAGGPGLVVDIPRDPAKTEVPASAAEAANSHSTFRVALAPGRLPTGEYTVSVVQQRGNEFSVCATAGKLRVG